MNIPKSKRKKALIIVDVQPVFLNEKNRHVVSNVAHILRTVPYDLYINAVFYADKNSMWKKQLKWTVPISKAKNEKVIEKLLQKKWQDKDKDNVVFVMKKSKSVFKGWVINDVMRHAFTPQNYLEMRDIEEVHIVGLDTNDCVLATAYEAFDLGYYTYVIEEATQSSSGNILRGKAIDLLRHVGLSNYPDYKK